MNNAGGSKMSLEPSLNVTDFFDISEKDTLLLMEVTKYLEHKVRLIFDPPTKRNAVGQQEPPSKCKIIVEKGDECFKDYVLFELQRSRAKRNGAKKVLSDAFAKE